jgi:hypothetical protein
MGTSTVTAWFCTIGGKHSLTVVAPIGAARISKRCFGSADAIAPLAARNSRLDVVTPGQRIYDVT